MALEKISISGISDVYAVSAIKKEFKKAVLYESCKVEGVNSYQAYYNIGVIYECLGYKDKALEYYEQCGDYENARNRVMAIKDRNS